MSQLLRLEDIEEICEEPLPLELLKDPYHPSNDVFYESLEDIRRSITHQQATMRPIVVEIIKYVHTGLPQTKIAEKLRVTPQTVSNHARSPNGKRLLQLIRHYQQLLDGPQHAHRQHMLYRIALDNELNRPNISIAAVQELNKMNGAYDTAAQSTSLNITINNELLPRGPLDQLPKAHVIQGQIAPPEDDV